ncbi:hypothetical protein DFH06DRAFT_1129016 [Mycena polygramma]|nr:hypothetical protein DFH06DRAFT_1129016 [Mycena polygramma]
MALKRRFTRSLLNGIQAGMLFHARMYEDAAVSYRAAIAADSESSIYHCNLAATYLKLERFEQAENAAVEALKRDRTSIKARFRRAMAVRSQGSLDVCILELYTVLVMDPGNAEVRSVFSETLRMYDKPGKSTPNLNAISELDTVPLHGSADTAPQRSHDNVSTIPGHLADTPGKRAMRAAIRNLGPSSKPAKWCHSYRIFILLGADEIPRPEHKDMCSTLANQRVLLRLKDKVLYRSYIRKLLTWYGAVATGMLHTGPMPCPAVLLVNVALLPDAQTQTQRITFQRIHAVPIALLPALVAQEFDFESASSLADPELLADPDCLPVRIVIVPNFGEVVPRVFASMDATHVYTDDLARAREPGFTFELYSHSFGGMRSLPVDLDVMFRALEDEIELDVDNYYGLRG